MNHLGEKIRKYRTSLKMTQADFADRLDVTELTNDQRRNLSEMAEIYRQFNRTCEVLSDETRKRAEQFISSGFLK